MNLKTIMVDGCEYYPVRIDHDGMVAIALYDCNPEDLVNDFGGQASSGLLPVQCLTCEELNIATYNQSVINFTDCINVIQPDTQGIIWRVGGDSQSVVDDETGIEVLRAIDGPFAENNAAVAAVAKDALAALIGIYYRIHLAGDVSKDREQDRLVLNYILQILRKAGVQNVEDFEYAEVK